MNNPLGALLNYDEYLLNYHGNKGRPVRSEVVGETELMVQKRRKDCIP